MSADPNAYTWEDILRAVTLPGRPDRLYHLQRQWYKTLQVLDVVSKALRTVRSQVDDHHWTGPGADAYRTHFDTMIDSIDKLYTDASAMMDIAETLGVNLASAIATIPCPNWSTAHNKSWDSSWQYYIAVGTANEHGGQTHYQYYTDHSDRFDSHGIKSYFQYWMQQDTGTFNNFTGNGQSYYESGGKQQLNSWYAKNTQQARNAFSSLIATYQDCQHSMPALSDDGFELTPDYSPSDSKGSSSISAGTRVSPNTLSAKHTPTRFTSGEPAQNGHSIGSSQWPGSSTAHDIAPYNNANNGREDRTSLAGSSPRNMSNPPGSYAAGGHGGLGSGAGGSGYGSSGYGSSSSALPVAGANANQVGLPTDPAETAGARSSNQYGAIPSSGTGRGSKDGETRQTWLTEDEDFFGPDTSAPPPVIDQNYMSELDERDRRRRDWW